MHSRFSGILGQVPRTNIPAAASDAFVSGTSSTEDAPSLFPREVIRSSDLLGHQGQTYVAASPRASPSWARRVHTDGDVRFTNLGYTKGSENARLSRPSESDSDLSATVQYSIYFPVHTQRYASPVLVLTDWRSTATSSWLHRATMSSMFSCNASISTRPESNVEPCSISPSVNMERCASTYAG